MNAIAEHDSEMPRLRRNDDQFSLHERRILLVAPTGNDAKLAARFLRGAGLVVEECRSVADICDRMQRGCGAIVLAEEALLAQSVGSLLEALGRQPSWSDIPLIIITSGGEFVQGHLRRITTLSACGNVALLERPFHFETLLSTVEVAWRGRQRQYQMRDLLEVQRASELRLQSIIGSITDAFVAVDKDGRVRYANPSFMNLVRGFSSAPGELPGQNAWKKFADLAQNGIADFSERVMDGQTPEIVELFYEPLGMWLAVHAYPSSEMLSVYIRDITERKRNEARAEGQKHVLELMAEDAPLTSVLQELLKALEREASNSFGGSILLFDEDGRRLRHGAAPSLTAAYLAAVDDLLAESADTPFGAAAASKKLVSVTDFANDPRWPAFNALALAHGLRACWSAPIFSRDGSVLGTFTMHYTQPREMNDEDRRTVAIATRTASIAIERERGQTALRESEGRYRMLMEQSTDGIFVCERDGRFVMANPAACRMTGYTPDEMLQRRIQDTYLPEDRHLGEQRLEDLGDKKSGHVERRMRRKDGSVFEVEANVTVLPGGFIFASMRDVTQRKQDEALLLKAKESAEAANRAKDRFLAVLSHELRTPLTPVLMVVSALEEDPDLQPAVREDLAMIRRNVELETKLIDDLLDVSRVASGKLPLRLEIVNLNEVVQQVCGICRPQVVEKGIHLHCDLGETVGRVHADPARLQQVLWNVLKNAAKFTPEGGDIYVRTTRTDAGRLRVVIRDTGIGVEPEALPRIFNAFEQGNAGIAREFGGLGLGLAISKALVELHKGSIAVASEGLGKGCTFTIELPAEARTREATHAKPVSHENREPGGLRLLLVEDHADTARTLGRLLGAAGFSVKIANNVATALQVAAEERFDVVVSDIGLPDATGYELMQKLRERGPIKGIAMSGYGMDEDVGKSREAGFSEHLVKPIEMTQLLDAIRRLSGHGDGG